MARNNTPNQKNLRNRAKVCCYCNRKLYAAGKFVATIDHFYPLSKDTRYLNAGWNKLIACRRCNQFKGNAMPQQFITRAEQALRNTLPGTEYASDLKDMIVNTNLYRDKLEGYFIMRDLI